MASLRLSSSDTKRELLLIMKRRGTASLDDAVAVTGLTRTTLREHLGQLERDGFVSRASKRHGRGRPSLQYSLTPEGERLFPANDGMLLGKLLDFLRRENREDLLRAFFEHFWEERYQDAAYQLGKFDPDDRKGRIQALEQLLKEQGFMPEVQINSDGVSIRECNCPFPEAVKHTRIPCRLEAAFFERLFGERVGRVTYIPDGSPACTYEFPVGRTTDE